MVARDVKLGDIPAAAADSDGDAASSPPPAKVLRTSLFTSYHKPAPSVEKLLSAPAADSDGDAASCPPPAKVP